MSSPAGQSDDVPELCVSAKCGGSSVANLHLLGAKLTSLTAPFVDNQARSGAVQQRSFKRLDVTLYFPSGVAA